MYWTITFSNGNKVVYHQKSAKLDMVGWLVDMKMHGAGFVRIPLKGLLVKNNEEHWIAPDQVVSINVNELHNQIPNVIEDAFAPSRVSDLIA